MLDLTREQRRSFAKAVSSARGAASALHAVQAIYSRIAKEVALHRPRCEQSGRCCHFGRYGHRMFVTTLEMACFLNEAESLLNPPQRSGLVIVEPGESCPFQVDRLCGVHAHRPMGCRLFYCDPASSQWQHDAYERFHRELREIHDRSKIPYFYVEWLRALEACRDAVDDGHPRF